MEMEKTSHEPAHIAIIVSPGMGHLIPAAELAKQLTINHSLCVTLITQSIDSEVPIAEQSIFGALPKQVNLVCIPPPPQLISIQESSKIAFILIYLTISYNLPHLRTILKSLVSTTSSRLTLVVDHLGVEVLDIAAELDIASYLFFLNNCMGISLAFNIPKLDKEFTGKFEDLPKPVELPGCVPFKGKDLPEPMHYRGTEVYDMFLRLVRRYSEVKGILVNSFEELEPPVVKALKEDKRAPPVYTVGPLVMDYCMHDSYYESLKWLDEQPHGSVLYVSFGSGGSLTRAQMEELALGLEMSGQRFLWVVKSPNEHDSSSSLSTAQSLKNPLEFLPRDLMERTKGLGMVLSSWIPQMKVLRHASTGGFLTHCGWNSSLESIVNAVPLIAWPLYAEQRLNAVFLAEGLKIALTVGKDDDGLVRREEISRVVKCLMEGDKGRRTREKIKELSEAACRAVGEGGSSSRSIMELVSEWKRLSLINIE
ncbi:putative hydroquinone glucosyltransferase [Dioscorea sansibarensis]